MEILTSPFIEELRGAKSILLAGAGGGFDVFSGLPLYFALRAAGKQVHLANLSFTDLPSTKAERLETALVRVTADSVGPQRYFPEKYLSAWFRKRGEEIPIYCFDRVGCVPLIAAYKKLIELLNLDAIVLIDGGTDSLMRGDEEGLGTPEEDMASIGAVASLDLPRKYLVCLGFGVDAFHGVAHSSSLEAIADLTKAGAFLGVISLLKEMAEVRLFMDAVQSLCNDMPHHPSIVSTSIASALDGHYGDVHATTRTHGSNLWINPLMTLSWCFHLEPLANRILFLEEVQQTQSTWGMLSAIDEFRKKCPSFRPNRHIPDPSVNYAAHGISR